MSDQYQYQNCHGRLIVDPTNIRTVAADPRLEATMFGVTSNFRRVHGEAAFQVLVSTAFTEADSDRSGKISTSELKVTLGKLGMKLTEAQTAMVMQDYDMDGNREMDEGEFLGLVSDLIQGTAKLSLAAKKSAEMVAARGVVKSAADLFGDSDDDEPISAPLSERIPVRSLPPPTTPARLHEDNQQLRADNAALINRVVELEAALRRAGVALPSRVAAPRSAKPNK